MNEQLNLFDQTYVCWRYYSPKCWECPVFIHGKEDLVQECISCGASCRSCTTPKGKYFTGCEYAEKRT
jgi:hypothetical protein